MVVSEQLLEADVFPNPAALALLVFAQANWGVCGCDSASSTHR